MELPTYFKDFIEDIRPTEGQLNDYKKGHTALRERLAADDDLAPIVVSTFLQGSYRRATAVRPQGDARPDVDVIVVTRLSKDEYTPQEALEVFVPFLKKHYKDKYRIQGRSIGISLSSVDLDLVVTSAPSEAEIGILQSESVRADESPDDVGDWRLVQSWVPLSKRGTSYARRLLEAAKEEPEWRTAPLYIPDRDADEWKPTHPLAQIQWTWEKNGACNGHYVNVVKALKWWRVIQDPGVHPKGYPLEHLIGVCCPNGITSVAQGVTSVLEDIIDRFQFKPVMPDHGVPEHDVLARISDEEYSAFYDSVSEAATIARRALDANDVFESANLWGKLFGSKFPAPPPSSEGSAGAGAAGGFTARTQRSVIGGGRYAGR